MKIEISRAQLEALEAAKRGELSRPDEKHEHWRIAGATTGPVRSLAVTPSARTLLARGFIREAAPSNGRITAIVTENGHAVLDEFASREPAKQAGNG